MFCFGIAVCLEQREHAKVEAKNHCTWVVESFGLLQGSSRVVTDRHSGRYSTISDGLVNAYNYISLKLSMLCCRHALQMTCSTLELVDLSYKLPCHSASAVLSIKPGSKPCRLLPTRDNSLWTDPALSTGTGPVARGAYHSSTFFQHCANAVKLCAGDVNDPRHDNARRPFNGG